METSIFLKCVIDLTLGSLYDVIYFKQYDVRFSKCVFEQLRKKIPCIII